MTNLKLKQLSSNGVSDEQVMRYNSVSNSWEPNDGYQAVPTISDKDLTPNITSGDDSFTGITISDTPTGMRYVTVKVNGVSYEVGNGLKTKHCYFSGDDGYTARAISSITIGDKLYWNGVISGFDLGGSDRVDLEYNTCPVISGGGAITLLFLERISVTVNTDSVTFNNLDGNSDKVYKIFSKIKNPRTSFSTYYIYPNGSSSDANCVDLYFYSRTGIKVRTYVDVANLVYGKAYNLGDCFSVTTIMADGGFYRGTISTYSYHGIAGSDFIGGGQANGFWNITTGNLTSIELNSDNGVCYGAGSEFWLYKLNQP